MAIHMREQLLRAVLAHASGEIEKHKVNVNVYLENPVGIGEHSCLLYTSPSPRDRTRSRMPSSA